jgi:GTP-binding protein Era
MEKMASTRHVSGFVSILGRPNAGKSTLLNALVGTEVAIVSSKPQTTRTSIQAVLTQPGSQIVFLDTPGVHQAKLLLHKRMMDTVRQALEERDLLLWLADASGPVNNDEREALSVLDGNKSPVFLALNKIDLVAGKAALLPIIDAWRQLDRFAEIIPISALTGEGLDELKRTVTAALPPGPQYFPKDFLTDQPERFLVAELVRERALAHARQEVPHAVAVLVEQWEETPRLARIAAAVIVERAGQKKILVGASGATIRTIGSEARQKIERLLGRKVYLELFVKVRPGWRDNAQFLNEIDWHRMAGGADE